MAIDLEHRDPVTIVTMNRPEALNAFDSDQMRRMIEVFREVGERRETRAIVLTGAGEKAFAAGADIRQMAALDPESGLAFGRLGHQLTRTVEETPQPVIAAVNGYALGGGCEVAIAADIRLASPNAVFGQPEVSLGIPPGWGGTQRLPRLVGPGFAAEMMLAGKRLGAEDALRLGIVNAVYPLDELLDRAVEMAQAIGANSPWAVRATKALIRLSYEGNRISGLDSELTAFGAAFRHADRERGMNAFLEKRKPTFDV
jgi:enoyl-CoA hydratase